jgi:isopentenyldiphosphate isomerase
MEKIEIVHHETGAPLGIVLDRKEIFTQNAWCRSTNVFVMNNEGKVLCHQRSLVKERMPGVWVTHLGGHVAHGETPATNVIKELEEEANIFAQPHEVIRWSTMPVAETSRVKNVRLWMHNFVTLFNGDASLIKPQPGEVEKFEWMSLEEILNSEKEQPHMWNAGIHDFHKEYFHLRAALMGAHAAGSINIPDELHVWRPISISN